MMFLLYGRGTSLKTLKRRMLAISASIASAQSFASGVSSASRIVCGSRVVGVGTIAGSIFSNALKANSAPPPPASRTKPERVERAGNWWTRPTYGARRRSRRRVIEPVLVLHGHLEV